MRTTVRAAYAALGTALVLPVALLGVLGPAPSPAAGPTPTSAAGRVASPTPLVASPPRPSDAVPPPPPRPRVVPVVARGDGVPAVVSGQSATSGTGPLQRYTVAVEGGLGVDPASFAAAVERTLADPRSWGAGGRLGFRRVDAGAVAFQVVLASPETTDRLCAPLNTAGSYSCANEGRAVINARRWLRGASSYSGDLPGYRQYVVNHEVGHTLGHGHERCPRPGVLVPVMVQQTKGIGACVKNPWPYPRGTAG